MGEGELQHCLFQLHIPFLIVLLTPCLPLFPVRGLFRASYWRVIERGRNRIKPLRGEKGRAGVQPRHPFSLTHSLTHTHARTQAQTPTPTRTHMHLYWWIFVSDIDSKPRGGKKIICRAVTLPSSSCCPWEGTNGPFSTLFRTTFPHSVPTVPSPLKHFLLSAACQLLYVMSSRSCPSHVLWLRLNWAWLPCSAEN